MLKYRFIHQPDDENHAAALQELMLTSGITNVDMAVAYASDSGVTVLLDSMDAHEPARSHWSVAAKRFVVGIDWFRSQPTALDRLAAIPGSKVRIYDGRKVVGKVGCIPRTSWHPKATFAYGADLRSAVHGSAKPVAQRALGRSRSGFHRRGRQPIGRRRTTGLGRTETTMSPGFREYGDQLHHGDPSALTTTPATRRKPFVGRHLPKTTRTQAKFLQRTAGASLPRNCTPCAWRITSGLKRETCTRTADRISPVTS